MVRRTNTYAIRLAVEGGGQVKAELVSVGQSGEQALDMALRRFTRRTAEAAKGNGEAKDALASMGITLRDQDEHLRRGEDPLAGVADAFARIEDLAERVRLAFKLFDSKGVALVNLLSDGSGALDQMRERARDLGIVLDEHLVRDAQHERRVAEVEALRAKDGSNAEAVDRLIGQSAAVRDAQLSVLRSKEAEAADKIRAANDRVLEGLSAERAALTSTERERFVAQALSRLSAEATTQQRREVEELAGALHDEQQALQTRQRLMDEGRSVTDRTRTRPSSMRPRSRS